MMIFRVGRDTINSSQDLKMKSEMPKSLAAIEKASDFLMEASSSLKSDPYSQVETSVIMLLESETKAAEQDREVRNSIALTWLLLKEWSLSVGGWKHSWVEWCGSNSDSFSDCNLTPVSPALIQAVHFSIILYWRKEQWTFRVIRPTSWSISRCTTTW